MLLLLKDLIKSDRKDARLLLDQHTLWSNVGEATGNLEVNRLDLGSDFIELLDRSKRAPNLLKICDVEFEGKSGV